MDSVFTRNVLVPSQKPTRENCGLIMIFSGMLSLLGIVLMTLCLAGYLFGCDPCLHLFHYFFYLFINL